MALTCTQIDIDDELLADVMDYTGIHDIGALVGEG
jgi:Arc/MetJ family transcription regulator